MHSHRLDVYYDGYCPFCIRSKNVMSRFDFLHLLRFVSFRDLTPERMPSNPEDMERAMVTVAGERKDSGMHAVARILVRIPELFPLYLLVSAGNGIGIGEKLYGKIARSRYSFLVGKCVDQCAT